MGNRPNWLGVIDRDIEGTFVGVEGTCSPVPASENWWWSGEPKNRNGNEDCVMMVNIMGWVAEICEQELYPLCQLRNCHQPQCQ